MTEHLNFPVRSDKTAGDELLVQLARMTNVASFSASITLMVPGGAISGVLIARDEWLKEWTSEIRNAGTNGEVFAEVLTKIMTDLGVYILDSDFPAKDRPTKLHVKDGYITTSAGERGPYLLRVRIDSVSAWSLGTYGGNGA